MKEGEGPSSPVLSARDHLMNRVSNAPHELRAGRCQLLHSELPTSPSQSGLRPVVMETRSPVARLEIVYSPGHNSARFFTRPFASARLFASSTESTGPSL